MKLFISKNLGFDQNKTRLASEFTLFCAEHLPIEKPFEVHIVTNRKQHGIGTTAVYEVGNNCCKIYGKNRAFVDILRSIAHEMTHMMQDEMGLLIGNIRDAGGFHEDQANAKAGELIKLFAKSKEDRKAIYESKKNIYEGIGKASYSDPQSLSLSDPDDESIGQGSEPFEGDLPKDKEVDAPSGLYDKNKWVRNFYNAAVGEGYKISSRYRGPNDQSRVAMTYVYVKDALAYMVSHDKNNSDQPFFEKVQRGAYYFKNEPSWKFCKQALVFSGLAGAARQPKGVYNVPGGANSSSAIAGAFNKYNTPAVQESLQKMYNDGIKTQRKLRVAAENDGICKRAILNAAEDWKGYQKSKIANNQSTHMTGRSFDMALSTNLSSFKSFANEKGIKIRPVRESDHFHVSIYRKRVNENRLNESMGKASYVDPSVLNTTSRVVDDTEGDASAEFSSAGFQQLSNWPSPSPVFQDASTMKASDQLINDIKRSEGFVPHVYDDIASRKAKLAGLDAYENAAGTPTIGYGEAIFWKSQKEKAEKYRPYLRGGGKKMSKSEALSILLASIKKHTRVMRREIKVPITQNMYDALTSYSYNTGPAGIKKFKNSSGESILDLINKKDYVGAARVIQTKPTRGRKQNGGSVRLAGLVKRRKREANIFATGAQKLSIGLSEISGENILLAGDSQIRGNLGDELSKLIGIPSSRRVAQNGADGNIISRLISSKVASANGGIIISFGGNGAGSGADALIDQVKKSPIYKKDRSKIVFIGPPPAYNPTDYEYTLKVFDPKGTRGYDPADWQTRRDVRKETNRKLKTKMENEGFIFINPYDYLSNESSGSKDGIHYNNRLAKKLVNAIKDKLPKKK